MTRKPAMPIWVLVPLLTGLVSAGAQPSLAQSPSQDNPAKGALVFRVRSAFSLSPAMVASLQSKPSESPQSSASGSSKSESSAPQSVESIAWTEALVRELPYAAPLDLRLVGKNVVALIQIVPMEAKGKMVDLLVQGQVWVQKADGSLAFNTSFQSMSLALGSRLFFYPLGIDPKNGASIAVEIRVDPSPAR
ncbi:MAG TPA: hypothetical protein VIO60_07740 [Rectinemataceae bacterium]